MDAKYKQERSERMRPEEMRSIQKRLFTDLRTETDSSHWNAGSVSAESLVKEVEVYI